MVRIELNDRVSIGDDFILVGGDRARINVIGK
jgi:tRNA G37 N-methylase TrmD